MIELDKFKKDRIQTLRERLSEINDIVGLEATTNVMNRTDAFAQKTKEKNVALMKAYYDEMISIKKEIARLEGRKSFFDEEGN